MKWLLSTLLTASILLPGAAFAQTRLDHDVQKLWDDTFYPNQRGTVRTNWERRRDAERSAWCRYHPEFERCRMYRG